MTNWAEIVPTLSFWYNVEDHNVWLNMEPEWLQAFSAMLPRLIAQKQLSLLEVLQIPHMAKKNDVKRAIKSLKSKARGGSGEYTDSGQLQIQGPSQLRAWFSQFGYST